MNRFLLIPMTFTDFDIKSPIPRALSVIMSRDSCARKEKKCIWDAKRNLFSLAYLDQE